MASESVAGDGVRRAGEAVELPPCVWIVEDDESMRRSLQRAVESAGWEAVSFANGAPFLESYDSTRPGCVILDLHLPGMDGFEIHNALIERNLPVAPAIVFITGFGDIETAVEAMKSGASDFVEKPFREGVLLDKVRRAIETDTKNRGRDRSVGEVRNRIERLTAREREVLEHVVAGSTNRKVAAELGISSRTVEVHRHHIMQKLEASSLAELVRSVLEVRARYGAPEVPHAPRPAAAPD
jgi:FixJ family two-component response regulator